MSSALLPVPLFFFHSFPILVLTRDRHRQNTDSLSFNTCNPQWRLWRLIFFPLHRPKLHTGKNQGTVLKSTCDNMSPGLLLGPDMLELVTIFKREKSNHRHLVSRNILFCFRVFFGGVSPKLLGKEAGTCEVLSTFPTQACTLLPKWRHSGSFWIISRSHGDTWTHAHIVKGPPSTCSNALHHLFVCSDRDHVTQDWEEPSEPTKPEQTSLESLSFLTQWRCWRGATVCSPRLLEPLQSICQHSVAADDTFINPMAVKEQQHTLHTRISYCVTWHVVWSWLPALVCVIWSGVNVPRWLFSEWCLHVYTSQLNSTG